MVSLLRVATAWLLALDQPRQGAKPNSSPDLAPLFDVFFFFFFFFCLFFFFFFFFFSSLCFPLTRQNNCCFLAGVLIPAKNCGDHVWGRRSPSYTSNKEKSPRREYRQLGRTPKCPLFQWRSLAFSQEGNLNKGKLPGANYLAVLGCDRNIL